MRITISKDSDSDGTYTLSILPQPIRATAAFPLYDNGWCRFKFTEEELHMLEAAISLAISGVSANFRSPPTDQTHSSQSRHELSTDDPLLESILHKGLHPQA